MVYEVLGRVVASDTRGQRFESSHRQTFVYCIEKTKIKKKRPGVGPFLIKKTMVDVEARYPTVVSKCLLVKLYTN